MTDNCTNISREAGALSTDPPGRVDSEVSGHIRRNGYGIQPIKMALVRHKYLYLQKDETLTVIIWEYRQIFRINGFPLYRQLGLHVLPKLWPTPPILFQRLNSLKLGQPRQFLA